MNISKKIISICALLGTLLASLFLYKVIARSQVFLATSSPNRTYIVSLMGRKDSPHIPVVSHKVRFSALKTSKAFLSDKYLHSGDWFDPSFEILYPQHTWVNDNVLRFYSEENFSNSNLDILKIVNGTGKKIDYLRVTSDCLLLIFEVQPNTITELFVPQPRGNLRWISIEGESSNGQSIEKNGVDFVIPKGLSGPFMYNIYITEDGSRIESPNLEKYQGTE